VERNQGLASGAEEKNQRRWKKNMIFGILGTIRQILNPLEWTKDGTGNDDV
jgi:hypothetical protein